MNFYLWAHFSVLSSSKKNRGCFWGTKIFSWPVYLLEIIFWCVLKFNLVVLQGVPLACLTPFFRARFPCQSLIKSPGRAKFSFDTQFSTSWLLCAAQEQSCVPNKSEISLVGQVSKTTSALLRNKSEGLSNNPSSPAPGFHGHS